MVLGAALVLGGCNPFGSEPDPLVPKPATLHPETDTFRAKSSRTYFWKQTLQRPDKDSLLASSTLQAFSGGDTVVNGASRLRLGLTMYSHAGSPVPAAVLTRLGFQPERLLFDTAAIFDPGPGLPFPETPAIGWQLDTTSGGLRFVRLLDRVETISQHGKRHECWVFTETILTQDGAVLGTATTWMGATGMVRHRSAWTGFASSTTTAGTLVREITAL